MQLLQKAAQRLDNIMVKTLTEIAESYKPRASVKEILKMANVSIKDIEAAKHQPYFAVLFIGVKDQQIVAAAFKRSHKDRKSLSDREYIFNGVQYADDVITVGSFEPKCDCQKCGGKGWVDNTDVAKAIKSKLEDYGFVVVP